MTLSKLRIGTRASPLAMEQTNIFVRALGSSLFSTMEVVPMTTTGDKITDRPLAEVGGKGLFSKELEKALLSHEIDCAVHSLKDLEHTFHPDLTIAAVLPREVPWDAFISHSGVTLMTMEKGMVIGTCSPRRQAQLAHIRTDLKFVSIRGNVQTRLSKLKNGDVDGLILAQAGLRRLNMESIINEVLPLDVMVPAVGQGVIAIQTRRKDQQLIEALSAINDKKTFRQILTERSMLKTLQGDCYTPIAGYAEIMANDQIHLTAMLAHQNRCTYVQDHDLDPETLGRKVGEKLKQLVYS
jgi:hydroxymethylbilane synthase